MPPLMALPTQPHSDPLGIPSPPEVPALHLCLRCLSPRSGPGGHLPVRPTQAVTGTPNPRGRKLPGPQSQHLTAPSTNIRPAGPAGGYHSRKGSLAGSLLPVVQATLRDKGAPETPNCLHLPESVAKHHSVHWNNSKK